MPTWTAREENCLSLYYPGTPTPGDAPVVHLEVLLRGVFQDEVLGYRAFSIEEILEKGSLPREWYELLAPVLNNATEASKGRGVAETAGTAGKVLVEVDFDDEGLLYLSSNLDEEGVDKEDDEEEGGEGERERKKGEQEEGPSHTPKGKSRWSWGGRGKGKDRASSGNESNGKKRKSNNKKKNTLGTTDWPHGRWSPLDRGGLRAHRFDIATASTGNANVCAVCNKTLFIKVATLGLASRCYRCSQCELCVHEQCRERAESRLPCYLCGPNGLRRALGEVRVGDTVSLLC